MSHFDDTSAERQDQPEHEGGPPEGWRERAAFHVSIHSLTGADGQIAWQTRAYHEERDAAMSWPGPPSEELAHWLIAVAELPAQAEAPTAAQAPEVEAIPVEETPPPQPTDDFTQIIGISAATEQRLHAAGIRTYAQLAASSPAELAALLDMPPERITRRGWITRARALSKLASLPSAQGLPALQEPPAADPPPAAAGPALLVELIFAESGEILEQRLVREGERAGPPPGPEDGHIARLFLEPSALLSQASGPPIEVELELDDLAIEAAPSASDAPLLRARSALRLGGLGAAQLLTRGSGFLAYVLAHDLETGGTQIVASAAEQLDPERREQPLDIAFAMPEVGRYQTMLVAILADGSALSATAGPRLRVNP